MSGLGLVFKCIEGYFLKPTFMKNENIIKIPSEIDFFLYLLFSYQLDLSEDFFFLFCMLLCFLSAQISPCRSTASLK